MSAVNFIRCLLAQLKDDHKVTDVKVVAESWWQMTAVVGKVSLHANDAMLRVVHNGENIAWPGHSLKGKTTDTIKALILQNL